MKTRILLIASLLLVTAAVQATDNKPDGSIDATAAYAGLKSLAGEWLANTSMGKMIVTYELIAGGTALVERDGGDSHPAMVTVYHMDGHRLMLTHYCMTGNQPRMQARSFDAKTGQVRFQFVDATNMANADAGHMHNATIRIVDDKHYTADWDFYEGGQPKKTESFEFTRVR